MNGRVWPWALAGPLCSEPQAKRKTRPQASPQECTAGLPVGRCAGLQEWGCGENLPGAGLHLAPLGVHRSHRARGRAPLVPLLSLPSAQPACMAFLLQIQEVPMGDVVGGHLARAAPTPLCGLTLLPSHRHLTLALMALPRLMRCPYVPGPASQVGKNQG